MKNLKPFDLQAALSGKAVMLRDGRKAYVRHHETELNAYVRDGLLGYTADGDQLSWSESGDHISGTPISSGDIIGPHTAQLNKAEQELETHRAESAAKERQLLAKIDSLRELPRLDGSR